MKKIFRRLKQKKQRSLLIDTTFTALPIIVFVAYETVIVLHSICHTHLAVFDVYPDDWRDIHNVAI